jgi:hypothetical protein
MPEKNNPYNSSAQMQIGYSQKKQIGCRITNVCGYLACMKIIKCRKKNTA